MQAEARAKPNRMVWLGESGKVVGEDHPNARLTDAQVDEIRELREDHGMKYHELALMFGVHKQTIAKICQYQRRASTRVRCVKAGAKRRRRARRATQMVVKRAMEQIQFDFGAMT